MIESPISESSVSRSPKEKTEEINSSFTAHSLSPKNEILTLIPVNRDSEKSISTPLASSIIAVETTPPLQPIYVELLTLLIPEANITPAKPIYDPKDPLDTPKWSLSVSGGGNFFQPNYANNTDEIDRDSFEEKLVGWSAGLRINREFASGLVLSTGIDMERLRYLFKLDERFEVDLYRPNTPDTLLVNRTLRDTSIIFTDTIPGTRSILARQYNSHVRIAIPILLGYQINSQKWTHTLKAGPQLQLYRKSKGYTILEEGSLLKLEEQEAEDAGIILGIQTEYEGAFEITPKWMILTQIGVSKSIGEWSFQQAESLNQKPLILYGRLGIGKRF